MFIQRCVLMDGLKRIFSFFFIDRKQVFEIFHLFFEVELGMYSARENCSDSFTYISHFCRSIVYAHAYQTVCSDAINGMLKKRKEKIRSINFKTHWVKTCRIYHMLTFSSFLFYSKEQQCRHFFLSSNVDK